MKLTSLWLVNYSWNRGDDRWPTYEHVYVGADDPDRALEIVRQRRPTATITGMIKDDLKLLLGDDQK